MAYWVTAACSLLALLLYYNTLDAGFVYDDRLAILSNPDVIGHTAIEALFENDFWGTPLTDPGSHGSYRPLCVATFRLNYAYSGFKPWSYHFLNVILHCIATALVVITAIRVLPKHCVKVGSIVAGLVFAAHPIHTEAVASVVGRADLISCNLFLLSFLIYSQHIRYRERGQKQSQDISKKNTSSRKQDKKNSPTQSIDGSDVKKECDSVSEISSALVQWLTLAGTLLFAVAATLCKEPGIMVLPLCILYDFLKGSRQELHSKYRWRSVSALSMGGFALLYWRLRLAGGPGKFSAADNPASRDPCIYTRFYTFSYLPVFNFFLLLYPFDLSFDWSMESIPRITTILDPRNIATMFFYAILLNVTWRTLKTGIIKCQENPKTENKYYNKQSFKRKPKWSHNNKHHFRGRDRSNRKSHYTPNRPKLMCPCNGCKHWLTEEHTRACRTFNNNNIMMHDSNCICPKAKVQMTQKTIYKSPQVALLLSIAFMVLPFVPASNLLFYVGFVVAERVLYIPSVGLCLLLGLGAGTLTRNWHHNEFRSGIFMLSFLVALAAMCGYTLQRNLVWYDEESLFRSALHINPPKAYGNLGSVLTAQGRNTEAIVAFQEALKYRPNMADVHYNLGILFQNQKRYKEAISSFQWAINFRPTLALAYTNLGNALKADGQAAQAANILQAGSRVEGKKVRDRREHDAARVSSLVQLANLHSQEREWDKAISVYKEALQILPLSNAAVVGWTRHSVLSMTGDMYVELEQWPEAESVIRSALAIEPNNVYTHLTLAQIIAKNATRSKEAEKLFRRAITLAPKNPSARDQFGIFLRSQKRLEESSKQLVKSARLVPDDSERAALAGRVLRDAEHFLSAEQWYTKATQLNPKNAEYFLNLGAILHLNGKLAAAHTSYRRALQLQPDDKVTIANINSIRALLSESRNTT